MNDGRDHRIRTRARSDGDDGGCGGCGGCGGKQEAGSSSSDSQSAAVDYNGREKHT